MQRYKIVGDDSGHDYVIPVEREEEWWAIDFDDDITPDWAVRVEGQLTFTDPKYD